MKRTTNRNRHPLLRQGKKFFAQIPVCPEPSGCGNRPCKRPRFSDPPCRHTGMLPFQKNDYIPGTGNPFYDIPYIRSYPFLDLETLRDGIGDAGNFRQSDDAPLWEYIPQPPSYCT